MSSSAALQTEIKDGLSVSAPIPIKEQSQALKAIFNETTSDEIDNEDDDNNDECGTNYDDDHNNNNILDQSEEDNMDYHQNDHDEDDEDYAQDFYSNDPEYFDYDSYPMEKLDWIMEMKCQQVMDQLKLDDPLDVLNILRQFKWDHQSVIEYFGKEKKQFLTNHLFSGDKNNNNSKRTSANDRLRLISYVNIFESSAEQARMLAKIIKSEEDSETRMRAMTGEFCAICWSTKSSIHQEFLSLDECAHYFCTECWSLHFESHIKQGVASLYECMETKCNALASREFVLKCLHRSSSIGNCVRKKNLIDRYRKLIALDLIRESDDLQTCSGEEIIPGSNSTFTPSSTPKNAFKLVTTISKGTGSPVTTITTATNRNSTPVSEFAETIRKKCNFIVWIKSKPAARRVFCSQCEYQYCFLCGLSYHAPNSCQTIRSWNIKCQDDSETRNYLLVHTQDCPKCKVCIEKNGGCAHMTCNRCKHEFCWVCANDWKTHGATYDCNRYKGNPDKDNAREALNRYTHYYHRWINHANSLKFERALKEQSLLKIQEKIMNKVGGGTLVDWEFLIEAVDVLTRARYTLQYTYPYAYFLDNLESKALFENIQAELEREVENLSHSLEKVNLNDKFNIKLQMDIVEKRRKTLLKDYIQ